MARLRFGAISTITWVRNSDALPAASRVDVFGEPLPGESLNRLGERCGAGSVQIAAASFDDGEDLGEGARSANSAYIRTAPSTSGSITAAAWRGEGRAGGRLRARVPAGSAARRGPLRRSGRRDRCGREPLLPLLLGPQLGVLVLEVYDHRHAGDVEPGLQQVADAAQPVQVTVAIAACAALGALGLEQPASLIKPQRLHAHANQLRSDRNAIYAARRIRHGHAHCRTSIPGQRSPHLPLASACHE